MRRAWGVLLLSGVLSAAVSAHAEPSPSDMALAEALFRSGRSLMEANKFSDACPKLAESYHLDPKLGTLLNLALCHESDGKTASAWGAFNEAAALARRTGQPDREKFANDHAKTLEAKLSRIIVKVDGAAPNEHVELDGRVIGAGLQGTPLPLDPGDHRLEATAPGKARWEKVIRLTRTPAVETITIPPLRDAPASPSSSAAPATSAPVPSPAASDSTAPDSAKPPATSTKRTASYVVGGVGVAALGIGTIFGLKALSAKSDRDQHCLNHLCDPAGQKAVSDGKSAGNVSTVALSLGAVATGIAVVLFVTSSPSTAPSPSQGTVLRPTFSPGLAGLHLEHVW